MSRKPRAWVVGLSDLGRSPRLQNHAVSLASQGGFEVDVVAQRGSAPLPALLAHEGIHVHYVPNAPELLQSLPKLLGLPLKAVLQALLLLFMLLFKVPRPRVILLQIPPAIPTLVLIWLVGLLRRSRLVFDWHNFAYTLMAMSLSKRHALVRLAEAHERFWGRRGHAHLCVSNAMQSALCQEWGISAEVFYDRPPQPFKRATLAETHSLLLRLHSKLDEPTHGFDCCSSRTVAPPSPSDSKEADEELPDSELKEELPAVLDALWTGMGSPSKGTAAKSPAKEGSHKEKSSPAKSQPASLREPEESTICTTSQGGVVELREDRPALVVSSTSWTADEDFGVLLEAARHYDAQAASGGGLPRLLILVTGKGPQKTAYEQRMRALELRHVAFRTLWLEPADYPLLLGSCDLGVSLHTSSSGLDLPMKVVDMFGCGLPVAAVSYPCLSELVRDGENGLHFSTPEQLARQLEDVFQNFPQRPGLLKQMRTAVDDQWRGGCATWDAEWAKVVLPIVQNQLKAFSKEL